MPEERQVNPGIVLVVDDEPDMAESCAFFLERKGHRTRCAFSGSQALELLRQERVSLMITDLRMPRMSGLELLTEVKKTSPETEVVVITGFPEIQTAVAAIKQGAFDYLAKPYVEKDLMDRVERALAHGRLKAANSALRERLRTGVHEKELVYRSPAFREVVTMLDRAARTDASVLIQGESGTGKELLAHYLHDASARAGWPFVPVDCAAIPENLFESELFGHRKGAFTGATSDEIGLFQLAHRGTLFLDELGELPLAFQPKLLRAIQERQIRPIGATEHIAVDVRIVCATNRNLQYEVEEGRFRHDLFYRLDVVRVVVPPLRERMEDVDPLVERFLEKHGAATQVHRLSAEAAAAMRAYHWPGNVRQLENAVQRACALATGPEIALADLPEEVREPGLAAAAAAEPSEGTFQEMKARRIAAMESSYVSSLLARHRGNVTRCAEESGMTRSAFQKLMQRYGIRSSEYRD
ncbi:MAG: sigma-54 dependent transcriptional regulator [Planctomycetota bacterium]